MEIEHRLGAHPFLGCVFRHNVQGDRPQLFQGIWKPPNPCNDRSRLSIGSVQREIKLRESGGALKQHPFLLQQAKRPQKSPLQGSYRILSVPTSTSTFPPYLLPLHGDSNISVSGNRSVFERKSYPFPLLFFLTLTCITLITRQRRKKKHHDSY